MSRAHLVVDASGTVLAVFTDADLAHECADVRQGHTVKVAPWIAERSQLRTVHTRWIEVDESGTVNRDERDSYLWCPALHDPDDFPPVAEVEGYAVGSAQRLLCLGTDVDLLEQEVDGLLAAARQGLRPVDVRGQAS